MDRIYMPENVAWTFCVRGCKFWVVNRTEIRLAPGSVRTHWRSYNSPQTLLLEEGREKKERVRNKEGWGREVV